MRKKTREDAEDGHGDHCESLESPALAQQRRHFKAWIFRILENHSGFANDIQAQWHAPIVVLSLAARAIRCLVESRT